MDPRGIAVLGHWGTSFQVEINGIISPVQHRYGVTNDINCTDVFDSRGNRVTTECKPISMCTIVPFHTLVVKVDNGVISELEWDEDCSLCSHEYCIDGNNCASELSKCSTNGTVADGTTSTSLQRGASNVDCDFKIYVSWSGTDKDGVYLSSAGRRLSQFRRWSINSLYNQAANLDLSELPIAPPDSAGSVI